MLGWLLLQHHCCGNMVQDDCSVFESVDTYGVVEFGLSSLGLDVRGSLGMPVELKRLQVLTSYM